MKCARGKDLVPRDWKWNRFCYNAMRTLNLSCCLVSIIEEIPVTELAEKYAPILPWQHNKTEVLSATETRRKRKKKLEGQRDTGSCDLRGIWHSLGSLPGIRDLHFTSLTIHGSFCLVKMCCRF